MSALAFSQRLVVTVLDLASAESEASRFGAKSVLDVTQCLC
jgi:hypothetical protein